MGNNHNIFEAPNFLLIWNSIVSCGHGVEPPIYDEYVYFFFAFDQ